MKINAIRDIRTQLKFAVSNVQKAVNMVSNHCKLLNKLFSLYSDIMLESELDCHAKDIVQLLFLLDKSNFV